jgi:RNA 2',3'-cyclic 3'-phosphodiesterase
VAGSERLRLFCGLRLSDDTIDRLAVWQAAAISGGRIVPPGNLHLTLAFLGARPTGEAAAILGALREAAAGGSELRLSLRGYRETRSVGMLTFDDEGGRAAALAGQVQRSLEALGVYRSDARPWTPHLTVLRFRERPRLRPPLPELGVVSPSDAAVFISRLRKDGAQYEVYDSVPLGGR